MSRLTRGFAPLRHPSFRLLAGGQLASNIGDAFYMVALPWYVLASHGGALLLGTVLAAYGVPRTVLLIVGGHASDRWRPWVVMMASDTVRVAAAAGLAVAAASGPPRAVILVPIAMVLGAGEGMFLPGSYSIIPELLPDQDLQAGNALSSAGTQLATLVGPAIGGVMVALIGSAPAFGLDAASFALSALTLAGIRSARRTAPVRPVAANPPAGTEPAADTPTVLGLLRSERVLQLSLLVTVAANLGSGGIDGVALPALMHGPLHSGAGGYGAIIAVFGAGALVGTLVAAHLGRPRRPAILGSTVFLIEALAMAVAPYLGGVFGLGAACVLLGVANGFGNVVMITAWQRWAPPQLMGRLNGLLMTASYGVSPVSVVFGAFVTHAFGPASFFPIGAACLAGAVALGLTQRAWRNYGMLPEPAPATPAAEPSLASR